MEINFGLCKEWQRMRDVHPKMGIVWIHPGDFRKSGKYKTYGKSILHECENKGLAEEDLTRRVRNELYTQV